VPFVRRLSVCLVAVSFAAVALALAGCDSPPSGSKLKEWSAADHDRTEESARAASQGGQPGQPGPQGAPGGQGPDMVVEASWQQQCAACHGPIGHGDGPTGPMVHATDLTQADWQKTVTDDQLVASIMNGKGKMPPFANLPPKVIAGLVARIRASRGH
jgi:mono/diheme cytochrome c family protein